MNEALTELGRVFMTLRPKAVDKPQTKIALLDMAIHVIPHLEKKYRNLNPTALSLNRANEESVISDDDLDKHEATEPDQVPLPALGVSPLSPALEASPRSLALGASPSPSALGALPRYPALRASPICPVLGASSMYLALGASPRPPALVASPRSPALGASPSSPTNQNGSNPISYEDQKNLEDLSDKERITYEKFRLKAMLNVDGVSDESRETFFDILGWPQKVMGYLSSLIQSDEIPAKNTGKSAEKID
jgi:hypothetical protein